MGPALSKHLDPFDPCFPDFQRACARGRGGNSSTGGGEGELLRHSLIQRWDHILGRLMTEQIPYAWMSPLLAGSDSEKDPQWASRPGKTDMASGKQPKLPLSSASANFDQTM